MFDHDVTGNRFNADWLFEIEEEILEEDKPDSEKHRSIDGACFVIDVWNQKADLFALTADHSGEIRSYKVDHAMLDISEGDLLDAVKKSGGNAGINGSYPISKAIKDRLHAHDTYKILTDSEETDQKKRLSPEFACIKLFLMRNKSVDKP